MNTNKQNVKLITIESVCPECAGLRIVPHHHVTNKRNSKVCPVCKGEGQINKVVEEISK